MRRKLAICVAVLVGGSSLPGSFGILIPAGNYCVDSINGSDSNAGSCQPYAPFQSVTKVMQQALSAGTVIGLGTTAPGQGAYWQGQTINTSQNGLSFVGYGSIQPTMDCTAVLSPGGWTKTAGFTNIYQATVSVENVLGWIRTWENNVSFLRASSMASLDSTASEYLPSGDPNGGGSVSFTLFIHTSDGSNPGSNGKTYTFNQNGCLTLLGNNSTIINLHTEKNLSNNGSIDCHGSYCRLTDTLSEDGTKHNVYVGTGAYVLRSVAHNAYYGFIGSDLFVYNGNSPNGEGITFDSTNAYLDSATFDTTIGAYLGHVNISGTFGVVSYANTIAANTQGGQDGGNATLAVFVNNTVTNVLGGVQTHGPTVIVGGNWSCGTECLQIFGGPVSITNAAMTGEIFDFTGAAQLTISGGAITVPSGVNGYLIHQAAVGAGMQLSVHGCTLTGNHTLVYDLGVNYSLASDFNAFVFVTDNLLFGLGGTNYNSYAAYKAGSGQDQHSTP